MKKMKMNGSTTAAASAEAEEDDVNVISSTSSTAETHQSSKSLARGSITSGPDSILRMRRNSKSSTHDGSGDQQPSSRRGSSSSDKNTLPADDAHTEKQNRKVCLLRVAMISALLSATIVVATLVYLYVTRDEEKIFRTQYMDSVSKVAEAFQYGIDTKHDAASTFSTIYTSFYGNVVQQFEGGQKTAWPNATLPFFADKAKDLLKIADGRALSFNPIITQDVNRLEWEAHATESAWLLGDKSLVIPNPDLTWPNNRTVSFGITLVMPTATSSMILAMRLGLGMKMCSFPCGKFIPSKRMKRLSCSICTVRRTGRGECNREFAKTTYHHYFSCSHYITLAYQYRHSFSFVQSSG